MVLWWATVPWVLLAQGVVLAGTVEEPFRGCQLGRGVFQPCSWENGAERPSWKTCVMQQAPAAMGKDREGEGKGLRIFSCHDNIFLQFFILKKGKMMSSLHGEISGKCQRKALKVLLSIYCQILSQVCLWGEVNDTMCTKEGRVTPHIWCLSSPAGNPEVSWQAAGLGPLSRCLWGLPSWHLGRKPWMRTDVVSPSLWAPGSTSR